MFVKIFMLMLYECYALYLFLESNHKQLQESVIGIVVCRMGCPLDLPKFHDNYFVHEMDPFITDSATNLAVYNGQKPLQLFCDLIELYSAEGDWVLYAPSGVGKYLCLFKFQYTSGVTSHYQMLIHENSMIYP